MTTWTTDRLNTALDAALDGGTYAQLHTGDPGANGTSNVASGVDRTACAWGSASGGSATASVVWTIPAAGGPFTHYSVWTASSAGTFYTSGELSPSTTFESSGTLSSTITVPAASA